MEVVSYNFFYATKTSNEYKNTEMKFYVNCIIINIGNPGNKGVISKKKK